MARNDIIIRSKRKKADLLLREGNWSDAREAYRDICRVTRNNAGDWVSLSIINRNLGLLEEAGASSSKALEIDKNSLDANYAHACFLHETGDFNGAIAFYQKITKLKPDYANAYYQIANCFRSLGDIEGAESNYQKAISLNPDFLEALSNLGALLIGQGKRDEALEMLQRADRLRPNCEQVLCNLGHYYLLSDNPDAALEYGLKVLSINANFFDACYLSGKAYQFKGMFDDALDYYRRALELAPGDQEVTASICDILEIRGEHEEVLRYVSPLIESGNAAPSILIIYAAIARKFDQQENAIILLRDYLVHSTDIVNNIDIHHALAKLYDDKGNYDGAFQYYEKFNEGLDVLAIPEGDADTGIAKMISVSSDQDLWEGLSRSSHEGNEPIFVLGMPRSGTTLVEQILASHREVFGAGELNEIGKIAHELPEIIPGNKLYPACLEDADSEILDRMAKRYLSQSVISGKSRFVDKMPTNFLHVGLISLLFPNASIIHVRRNPLDTCLSIYFQKFGNTMKYTNSLEKIGKYYCQYLKLIENWSKLSNIKFLEVGYEELIGDFERVSREMVEFCGLAWDENCLSFYKNKRDVNTPSYDQVRQPIYTRSVERWRNYSSHIGVLLDMFGQENTCV